MITPIDYGWNHVKKYWFFSGWQLFSMGNSLFFEAFFTRKIFRFGLYEVVVFSIKILGALQSARCGFYCRSHKEEIRQSNNNSFIRVQYSLATRTLPSSTTCDATYHTVFTCYVVWSIKKKKLSSFFGSSEWSSWSSSPSPVTNTLISKGQSTQHFVSLFIAPLV